MKEIFKDVDNNLLDEHSIGKGITIGILKDSCILYDGNLGTRVKDLKTAKEYCKYYNKEIWKVVKGE